MVLRHEEETVSEPYLNALIGLTCEIKQEVQYIITEQSKQDILVGLVFNLTIYNYHVQGTNGNKCNRIFCLPPKYQPR